MLAFLVIAFVVYYFVVVPVERLMERYKGEPPVAPVNTRDCPYCLSKIPIAATRCAFCIADVSSDGGPSGVTAIQ